MKAALEHPPLLQYPLADKHDLGRFLVEGLEQLFVLSLLLVRQGLELVLVQRFHARLEHDLLSGLRERNRYVIDKLDPALGPHDVLGPVVQELLKCMGIEAHCTAVDKALEAVLLNLRAGLVLLDFPVGVGQPQLVVVEARIDELFRLNLAPHCAVDLCVGVQLMDEAF